MRKTIPTILAGLAFVACVACQPTKTSGGSGKKIGPPDTGDSAPATTKCAIRDDVLHITSPTSRPFKPDSTGTVKLRGRICLKPEHSVWLFLAPASGKPLLAGSIATYQPETSSNIKFDDTNYGAGIGPHDLILVVVGKKLGASLGNIPQLERHAVPRGYLTRVVLMGLASAPSTDTAANGWQGASAHGHQATCQPPPGCLSPVVS